VVNGLKGGYAFIYRNYYLKELIEMDNYDCDFEVNEDDFMDPPLAMEVKNMSNKKINICLTKKTSFLDNIILLELTDPNLVAAIRESKEFELDFKDKYSQQTAKQLYINVSEQLKQYNNSYDKKLGAYKVLYKKTDKHKWGRVFPKKALGFTAFSRVIRNTLMKDFYIDLDIKNAQPEIINNICVSNNIQLETINEYCKNRDSILSDVMKEYDVDRKTAKNLFLSLAFFGSFKSWCLKYDITDKKALDIIKKYVKDINTFYTIISKENEQLLNTVDNSRHPNKKGSFLSLYLQEYETRIMENVIYWLCNKTDVMKFKNSSYSIGTYEFDGIKVLKENVNKYGIDKLIKDIEKVIYDELGFNIKFEEKPIEDWVDIEYKKTIQPNIETIQTNDDDDNIDNGVSNDKEAAEKVYKVYPYWKYCLGTLYVFDNKTGMWSSDDIQYKKIIMAMSEDLRLIKIMMGKPYLSNESYGSKKSLMDVLPSLIKTLCVNDDWLKQKECSSLGKLLFNNGYLDLKNGFEFYDKETYGFNPDILFMAKIDKDFLPFDEKQMEYVNDIKQRLFYNPLGKDVGDYYILNIARGLMGDMMKRVLFGLGTTDCGKSILTKAMEHSLGGYVGSFNAENLLYRKTSCDEGQLMRWALLLRFKRIIISNEMKSTSTINGNMLKKLSSGGDSLTGRLHCGNETPFVLQSLMILMANDLSNIVPYDKAVDNRTRVINYKKLFTDVVEDKENELQKDYNLENEIKTADFQNAFIMMLIQEYVKYKEEGEPGEPEDVINGKKEWITETGNDIDKFLENFEITNDEKDFLLTEDITLWLKEAKIGITSTKMGIEIGKYCKKNKFDNVISKKKKIEGKSLRGYVGIKQTF
jgi:hypothetical protein